MSYSFVFTASCIGNGIWRIFGEIVGLQASVLHMPCDFLLETMFLGAHELNNGLVRDRVHGVRSPFLIANLPG